MAGEPTFNPTRPPVYPVSRRRAPRVNTDQYGDGYIARSRDGINHNPLRVQFRWDTLTEAEAENILDFFELRGGTQAFLYTVPGEDTARKFICPEWDDDLTDPGTYSISATFQQVFDL